MKSDAERNDSGANRGRSNPGAGEFRHLDVAAELVHLANVAAKAFASNAKTQRRFYDIKESLLSTLILNAVPGVRPSWQPTADGFPMLVISVGDRRALHCPFRRLSWAAQAAVVQRIGPCPTRKRK